ncbi:trypsin-like peptidase domain-containing protein [bacterium]|nr:trypsin-like peptidase domain-containing protein [candidate division CSSED10-310 bacterium]
MKRFSPILTALLVPIAFAQESPSRISPVVKAVQNASPAVVNISTEKVVSVREFNPFGQDWILDFFEPYTRRNVTRQSLGSGVIIRPDGTVLTNEHVILPASIITVTLSDGSDYPAELIGASRRFDLAILKINADISFPYINPGSSDDLMIGETVIAIGNPFGLSSSVTTGVISALNRSITLKDETSRRTHTYHDFIQTDSSINPGNSGGPLLNINGELIGINTAIYANAEGIGFAIPIDKARRIIDDLIEKGKVPRIWMGVQVQELTPLLAQHLQYPGPSGVLIAEVRTGSPGSEAGLKPGDILLSLGGRSVQTPSQFREYLREYTPGDVIEIELWQRGRTTVRTIHGTEFPEDRGEELTWELLGLNIGVLDAASAQRNRMRSATGILVISVREGSPAHQVGIRRGDAVVHADGQAIQNPKQFHRAVQQAAYRDSITCVVVRGGTAYRVTLELE